MLSESKKPTKNRHVGIILVHQWDLENGGPSSCGRYLPGKREAGYHGRFIIEEPTLGGHVVIERS